MNLSTRTVALLCLSITLNYMYGRCIQFNDEYYCNQWYLHSEIQNVWNTYTGNGVIVGIVDNGINYLHKDLEKNFDEKHSYNLDEVKKLLKTNTYSELNHGTRCAGLIAAVPNNTHCIVGIAHDAKIASIRLSNDVTDYDEDESKAFYHMIESNMRIYSNSWGLDLGGPEEKTRDALQQASEKGRIFVFSVGNNKSYTNCAFDGFINSQYVIGIGSVDTNNSGTEYSEECPAVFAVSYGGSKALNESLTTTDGSDCCSNDFIGNSASAAIASGIIALTLEANSRLTWRDVQYLIAYSSIKNRSAKKNAADLQVSNQYGFGVINAKRMISLAKNWQNVPKQHTIERSFDITFANKELNDANQQCKTNYKYGITVTVSADIVYLESVLVSFHFPELALSNVKEFEIISPSGTNNSILFKQKLPANHTTQWPLKFLNFWGENVSGKWKILFCSNTQLNENITVQFKFTGINTSLPNLPNIWESLKNEKEEIKTRQKRSTSSSACKIRKPVNVRDCYYPRNNIDQSNTGVIVAIVLCSVFGASGIVAAVIFVIKKHPDKFQQLVSRSSIPREQLENEVYGVLESPEAKSRTQDDNIYVEFSNISTITIRSHEIGNNPSFPTHRAMDSIYA